MTEHTGGHYLDIGDGPMPLTSAAVQVIEATAREAYRTYADHSLACDECKRRLWNCETGKALWAAYRDETA
jgi:hypothetical protein